MNAPLVFLDTETMGLNLHDAIWEIAYIRREVDGTEERDSFQLLDYDDYDPIRSAGYDLPKRFANDFERRYDPEAAKSRASVKFALERAFRPGPNGEEAHLVGMNPAFDALRIERQFGVAPWHYHLIDVEAMMLGRLASEVSRADLIPWRSDQLASMVGINPDDYERHTAADDALFARDCFDAVTRY